MTDDYAGGADVPAGAVPGRDWRRLPWPDVPTRDAPEEAITTSAGIFRAAESLLREARSDWMTIRPPDWSDGIPEIDPVQLWPVPSTQHIHVRAVYPDRFTARPPGRPLVRKRIAAGEEARVSLDAAVGLLLADTTAALLVLPPGVAMLVRDTGTVRQLRAFFEEMWEASVPFGRPALPPRQEKFLDLLAQGRELDEIADELGISRRAAHGCARDIRRRLGARTMAQAGALASLRGWIDC